MKPLFVSIFVLLTITVSAEVPSELLPLREMPTYAVPSGGVTTMAYTVHKPTETQVTLPQPLALPYPTFPKQERQPPPITEITTPQGVVRGQLGMEELAGIMSESAPLAKGSIGEGMIDPKLIDSSASSDFDPDALSGFVPSGSSTQQPASGVTASDPLGYGMLVLAMIVTTLGLVIMAFVAYDYHQRWVQALTVQNDRYLGGGTYEMEMEDTYGTSVSFSEGFGLPRRSSSV